MTLARTTALLTLVVAVAGAACAHPGTSDARRGRGGPRACTGSACHAEGWVALRAGDDRRAAARFLMGCDSGDDASCADLAALHAAGRGVRRDDARACALGLADACHRAGEPPPETARVGTGPLPEAEAREKPAVPPASVENALGYAHYYVKKAWRAPLGLTREALAEVAPAPPADVAMVTEIVAHRIQPLERCLPLIADGSIAMGAQGMATFVLGPDGRPSQTKVLVSEHPGQEASVRCAEQTLAAWEFPLPAAGGRVWLELEGRGRTIRPAPPAAPQEPVFAGRRVTKPAMKRPNCVGWHLAGAARVAGGFSAPVTLKFAVMKDGSIDRLEALTRGVPVPLLREIERAIRSCEFEPGRIGRDPISVWVVLPVRFGGVR